MTAIFGIIQHDQSPIPPESLTAAADSLRHHAEHGLEIWQAENIALGQALTRFWTNSARTPAPQRDPERGLTLVADARLDNRAELADRLGISPSDLPGISDSRLLLHAYAAWGADCPRYLLGDFVFAVWEERERRLFAARDPIGIRWLYYFAGPRRFAFASDMAGLLDLMDEAPNIDMRSLDYFLTIRKDIPPDKTFYSNIIKIQPGECLILQGARYESRQFWQPAQIKPNPELRDPREGIEILRDLLHKAVICRSETVDYLGTHLSGGLDSSAITALAVTLNRESKRPDPLAFSWSPPLEMLPLMEKDERRYVQRIAEYLNIPVTYTNVPPRVDILHQVSDPSTLPLSSVRFEQIVMENARQQGVRVLLSGWGGDELVFSRGIGYPSGLIKQGRFLALARYLMCQYGWNPYRWLGGLYTHGLYPLFPSSLQQYLPLSLRPNYTNMDQQIIAQTLKANQLKLPSQEFFEPTFYNLLLKKHKQKFQWIVPGLRASQLWYLSFFLLKRIESWGAWSAHLGARHAYPLLDQRVVEFALSMPEDWICYGGKLRDFGRQVIADIISPEFFFGRDKQDRAIAVYQKTIDHKWDVHKGRLEIFEAHWQSHPPIERWLNFGYLHKSLLAPPTTPENPLPDEFRNLSRIGLWNVLNFAFIDRRAVLIDEL